MSSADFTARVIVDGSQIEQLIGILGEVNSALQQSGSSFQEYASQNQAAANTAQEVVTATQGQVGPLNQLTSTYQSGVAGIQEFTTTEQQLGPAMQNTNAAIESGVGPLSQLGVGMQTTATESTEANTAITTMNTTTSEMGGIFAGAGTETQAFNGALVSMNAETQAATGGLTEMNTVTGQTTTATEDMAAAQGNTEKSTHSLLSSVGTLTSSLVAIGTTIFGTISSFEGMEKAQIKAEAANRKLSLANEAVDKAQRKYNDAVAKFGPNSQQAQDALRDLTQANQQQEIAQGKANIATDEAGRAQAEFILSLVGTAATMGGTITSIQQSVTELVRHRQAVKLAAVETTGMTTATSLMSGGLGGATVATGGLGASFAAIIAPILAAVALFALIETNTFGMGDAFRSTVDVVASAVDGMISAVKQFWNELVGVANNIAGFNAQVVNGFISMQNGIIDALNAVINGAIDFVNSFNTAFGDMANFLIDNVFNQVIAGFNTMLSGLAGAAARALDPLKNVFNTALKTIVDGFVTAGQTINRGLAAIHAPQIDLTPLTDLQYHLNHSGTEAKNTGALLDTSFKPIPAIPKINTDLTQLQHVSVGTKSNLLDVTSAFHTFDGQLVSTDSNVAQSVATIVKYYSEGKNLGGVINSTMVPAVQNAIKAIKEKVVGGEQLIQKLIGVGTAEASAGNATKAGTDATQKSTVATQQAAKAQEDLATKMADATAKQNQEIAQTINLIGSTTQLNKVRSDTAKAYVDSTSKLNELIFSMTDATSKQNLLNQAAIDGAADYEKFILETETSKEKTDVLTAALQQGAAAFGGLPGYIAPTVENLKAFISANIQGGEAAQKFRDVAIKAWGDLTGAADDLFKGLQDAFHKGGDDQVKAFEDAWNKIPPIVKNTLDDSERSALESAAQFADVGQAAAQAFGANLQAHWNDVNAFDLAKQAAIDVVQGFGSQNPQFADEVNRFLSALQTATPQTIQGVLAEFSKMPGPFQNIMGQMAGQTGQLTGAIQGVGQSVQPGIIDPVTGLPSATASPIDTTNAQINTIADTFIQVATAIQQAITRIPAFFATNFNTAVQSGIDAFNRLRSATNTAWSAIQGSIAGYLRTAQTAINQFISAGVNRLIAGFAQARSSANTNFSALQGAIAGYLRTATTAINSFIGILGRLNQAFAQTRSAANTAGQGIAAAGNAANGAIGRMNGLAGSLNNVARQASSAAGQVNSLARQIAALQNRTIVITVIQRIIQQGAFVAAAPTRVGAAPTPTSVVGAAAAARSAAAAASPATITTQQNVGALSGSLGNLVASFGITKDQANLQFRQMEVNIDKYLKLATATTADFNSQLENTNVAFNSAGDSATAFGTIIQGLNDISTAAQKAVLFLNANILVTKFFSDFATSSVLKLVEAIDSLHDKTVNVNVNQTTNNAPVPVGTAPTVGASPIPARAGGGGVSKLVRIEIPLTLNGKELARAIRQFIFEESGQF